ncbi:MAG TPA: VOC family protein [Candidatus Binatus sp.]|jgi:PhnB protein|nr:VOC family protein [Candidatus Binatus sp.]
MSEAVKPIPEGYHSVTPHLVCRDAWKALDFYKNALGAEIRNVSKDDRGNVMHAELKIGDSIVMLSDEFPAFHSLSPLAFGGTAVSLHLYTEDADAVFSKAVQAGAKVTMPIMDAFWGDRYGQVIDPYGHQWAIATRKRVPTQEEMRAAIKAFSDKEKSAGA